MQKKEKSKFHGMTNNEEIEYRLLEIIQSCVDEIWEEYDTDGNGSLDKDEVRLFIEETLLDLNDQEAIDEEDFEKTFKEFDKDDSGTIDKTEMADFIKKISGLD